MTNIEVIKHFRDSIRKQFSSSKLYYSAYPYLISSILASPPSYVKNEEMWHLSDFDLLLTYLLHFTEIYRYLNYLLYVKEIEDDFVNRLFEELKNATNLEDLAFMFLSDEAYSYLEEAASFYGLSAFDKVLYTKALAKEDIKRCQLFNPFFIDEHNHYNVEVNESFLLRQMMLWMKHCHDFETTLNAAVHFLKRYQKIDYSFSKLLCEKYGESDQRKILTIIYQEGRKKQ